MRRREVIAFLGALGAARPLTGFAQQSPPNTRRIAWFGIDRSNAPSAYVDALRSGLRELGWIDGSNLSIGLWSARREDMDAVARDLLASRPEIIVAQELLVYPVLRLKPEIPVVFGFSGDPVEGKLVDSFARPGRNLTGMSYLALELVGKRIELLKDWLPNIKRVAILARPQHAGEQRERQASQAAASKLGIEVSYFPISFVPMTDVPQLDKILHSTLDARCDALVVFPDAGMFDASERIAGFAVEHKLPSVSGWAPFASNGLLLTYGPNLRELYRSLARYVDRILKGANPNELPVALPSKIELAINLQTARAMGLTVPPSLLASADEVIE